MIAGATRQRSPPAARFRPTAPRSARSREYTDGSGKYVEATWTSSDPNVAGRHRFIAAGDRAAVPRR